MNNFGTRHPDEGQLLRYLDGELPGSQARHVRRHLEACWQCREALEGLQNTVGDCVRYRRDVLAAHTPPAPGPWRDLSRDFARIDAEAERGSFAARLLRALAPPPVRWTAAGAAALAVIAAIVFQLRETPSVQAAALLRKAVAAATARPTRPHRIQIKTATAQFTRIAGEALHAASANDSELARVEALFRRARYPWGDPLSAHAFQSWRDGLAQKRDEVSASEDGRSYRISTITSDGELVAATLTLRSADLEPTEGRFEFSNREWVEVTESADLPEPPASEVAKATGGIPSKPDMPPPLRGSGAEAPAGAGVADEVQVVAALPEVGADLGDPLEISLSGGRVVVAGAGIPAQRQRQIQDALHAIPSVELRFSDEWPKAGGPPAVAEVPAPPPEARASDLQWRTRLQERLGGRAQFDRFNTSLLDRMDAAMSRAYALKRLAQQFPPESERQMSAENRRLLRNIAREHLSALSAAAGEVDAAMRPFLPSVALPGPIENGGEPGAWQPLAEEVLKPARQVETSVAALLGATPNQGAEAPLRFASGMANLKFVLERCQRLLSYDDVRQRK